MPFFYKITDYFTKHREKWLDAVKFAIGDFSEGCNKKDKGNIVILIFRLEDDEINPHKHIFEYITEKDVEPSKQIGKFKVDFQHEEIDHSGGKRNFALFQRQLESIKTKDSHNERSDIDNLYIHITCKSNYKNIKKMGLLHKVHENDRIGDRTGGKNKKTKRKQYKKNKSMKRKL